MKNNDWKIITAFLVYKAFVISATLYAVTELGGWWAFLILFSLVNYTSITEKMK